MSGRLALTLGLWAVAGAAVAGALAAPAAGADPLVAATVYSSSGVSTDSVSLAALQANPQCPQYGQPTMPELGRQGPVTVSLAPSGPQTGTWALATILGCLQTPIALAAVTGATVINADGSPQIAPASQLTPADLATPSDFADSTQSPVVQADGSVNQYDRPSRGSSNGEPDEDFDDEVQESQDGQPLPIAIDVFEGPLLSVTASASPTTVAAGSAVSFTATVSPPGQGGLAYSWEFGGGAASSTAPAPLATFAAAGTYEVTVEVTDEAGGGGGATIPITVGTPAPSVSGSQPVSGTGTSTGSHPATGPRRSRGTKPGAAPGKRTATVGKRRAKTAGPGNGTRTAHSSPSSSSQSTTTTVPAAPSASSAATGPTAASRSSKPAPASKPAPSEKRRTLAPTATSAPGVGAPSGAPLPQRAAASTNAGPPLVAGRLISDVRPLPPGTSPLVQIASASLAAAPAARRAVRASSLLALGAGLAVVGLLALGAGRELRGRSGRRAQRLHS
ncbi:MAG: PKD domain-containing protein [Solirubrobacteraceae bacterium]